MEQRNIGRSGLRVSALGLGCNNIGRRLDTKAATEVVRAALDLGVNHFDTADVYPMGGAGASEEILGKALAADRDKAVIATKFGYPHEFPAGPASASRRWIMHAVEASLSRLGTDRIDLYYLHKPDPATPLEETVRACDDLIRAGKVRYVGCSNLPAWQTVQAQWIARELGANRFICAQEEYSLVVRDMEREMIPALLAHDMALVPFFPLASGLLTGKYRKDQPWPERTRLAQGQPLTGRFATEANLDLVERLSGFCEAHGKTLLDLAFAWLLARAPVASVIAGAMSPAQLEANAEAVTWVLTAEEVGEVDALAGGTEAADH